MPRDASAVRKQLADAVQFVRSRIYTVENEFARRLLREYQRAYEEQARILDDIWRRHVGADAWTVSDRRWQARTADMIDQIAAQMDDLNKRVHDELVDEQVRAWKASYAGNGWIVDRFSTPDYAARVPVLPVEAIRAQLLYPYEGNTQFFRLEANRTDFITKLRASMVQSQIQGETVYQAQKRLADALGLPIGRRNLSDRQANGGNFNRTEMIARTELLRSSNLGAQAVYQANSDVVKEQEIMATLDARTCGICGPKDGKRVPLDSTDVPPWHPNCVIPGQLVSVPGSISAASKAFYVGRAVEIVTRSGRRISVTENHPVLTAWGWVPAHLVGEFPEVVVTPVADGVALGVSPNDHNMPTRIEEIFDALVVARGVTAGRVKVSAEDFHGDARRFNGDIDVVNADGLLLNDTVARFAQALGQHGFDFGDVQGKTFARVSTLGFDRIDVNLAAALGLGFSGSAGALRVSQERLHEVHGLRDVAGLYPEFNQPATHDGTTYAELTRQFLFGFPCDITTDKVVDVRQFDFSGHVYDLQCDPYALYSVNTVVVKNCRCTTVPITESYAEMGLNVPEMGPGTRASMFGPVRGDMKYADWARTVGLNPNDDGGLADIPPGKPPKTPGATPARYRRR